jgi:hypothetical protein
MQAPVARSPLKILVIAAAVVCVAALMYIPTYVPRHPTGPVNAILNNLRKIEGAKELWMAQHAGLGDVELTDQDLASFLPQDFWKKPIAGERYIISRPNVPPEAVLTRSVQDLPRGTRLRFGNDGKVEEIRPKSLQRTRRLSGQGRPCPRDAEFLRLAAATRCAKSGQP